jgi:hypothetical protein
LKLIGAVVVVSTLSSSKILNDRDSNHKLKWAEPATTGETPAARCGYLAADAAAVGKGREGRRGVRGVREE